MTVPRRLTNDVLVKYGTSRNVVGYGNRNPLGVSDVCAGARDGIGGADVVGGREGGNSDKRVSRHQKLCTFTESRCAGLPLETEVLTGTTTHNPRCPVLST